MRIRSARGYLPFAMPSINGEIAHHRRSRRDTEHIIVIPYQRDASQASAFLHIAAKETGYRHLDIISAKEGV